MNDVKIFFGENTYKYLLRAFRIPPPGGVSWYTVPMDTGNGLTLVLLVDDDKDILEVYKIKLEQAGFRVVTALDGAEAIRLAVEDHPGLILMDMRMPIMNGIEAEMKLKENPTTKDIKVVFLTAFSDPSNPAVDREKAREIGALDFLEKNISLDELTEKVRGYLKQ